MRANSRVIYSCVIGGYDVVFPPLLSDPDIDYVMITDDPHLEVPGWQIKLVERNQTMSESQQNRYYKVFCHKVFPEHRSSIYIDGNLRPLRSLKRYLEWVETMPCDMMVCCHHMRSFVFEEVEACIAKGKVSDEALIRSEYAALIADGFEDQGKLLTNNVLVRDHGSAEVADAMELWWRYITSYAGRDQISLPHVLRKTGVRYGHLPRLMDTPARRLQIYPHFGKSTNRLTRFKGICRARAPEGGIYALVQKLFSRL